MLPGIMSQIDHSMLSNLKNALGGAGMSGASNDDDDVPDLVENFESSK